MTSPVAAILSALEAKNELILDESRALAENIAANLGLRQTRNDLEASVKNRDTIPKAQDKSDLDLTPQQANNLEASFKTHIKASFRSIAEGVAQKLKSRKFMAVGGDALPAPLGFKAYTERRLATLGPHPRSGEIAIPIPPELESQVEAAAELLPLTPKQRAAEIARRLKEQARGNP